MQRMRERRTRREAQVEAYVKMHQAWDLMQMAQAAIDAADDVGVEQESTIPPTD